MASKNGKFMYAPVSSSIFWLSLNSSPGESSIAIWNVVGLGKEPEAIVTLREPVERPVESVRVVGKIMSRVSMKLFVIRNPAASPA